MMSDKGWGMVVELGPIEGHLENELLVRIPRSRATRARRFIRPRNRHESVVAELLVRWQVARLLGVSNGDIAFDYSEKGKPLLRKPGWNTSRSHSHGFVAATVSPSEVGIDIERRRPAPLEVADRWFTPAEAHLLQRLGDPHRAFWTIWTRKEAWLKHWGGSLSDGADGMCAQPPPPSGTWVTTIEPSFVYSTYSPNGEVPEMVKITFADAINRCLKLEQLW